MIHLPAPMKIISVLRQFLPAAALCAFGLSSVSCSSTKSNTAATGQYAEYGTSGDGAYRPYSGGQQPYSQPTYQQPAKYTETSGGYQPQSTSKSAAKKKTTPVKKVASSSSAKKETKPTTSSKTTKSSGGSTHIVKHGDTLYSLAKRYHTTVDAIKKANGKSTDILRDGEKLKIP